LGFFQSDFANTLDANHCPGGVFAYVALGCRRIIPFTPNSISYFANSRNYVKTEITRNVLRRLTGNGILVVDGNEHRRQRRILNPAFASQHIKNLVGHFWLKGCELRDYWERNALNSDETKGYEVFNTLTRTTLDIIGLAG
jgi:cytochrome P450